MEESVSGRLTAERAHLSVSLFKDTDGVHGILVGRLELRVGGGLTLEVHLSEHVERRLLTSTSSTGARLVLQRPCKLPSVFVAAESERLTVLNIMLASISHASRRVTDMAGSDDFVLAIPDKAVEWQQTS